MKLIAVFVFGCLLGAGSMFQFSNERLAAATKMAREQGKADGLCAMNTWWIGASIDSGVGEYNRKTGVFQFRSAEEISSEHLADSTAVLMGIASSAPAKKGH